MTELNDPLSEREQEILRLVATGAANKEIAHQLTISPNTVKVHVRNIFAKIGVSSRTEATLYAIKIGLVQAGDETPAASTGDLLKETFPPGEATAHLQGLPGIMVDGDEPPQRTAPRSRRIWPVITVGVVVILAALVILGARLFPGAPVLPTVVSQAAPTQPVLQRWFEKPSLPSPRRGMGVAEYGGAFYVIGGESNSGIDGALLRFDPANDSWTEQAEKPTPVTDVQAALIGEKIYVPGGRMPNGSMTDRLEVYDPRENKWETRASLPAALSAYALAPFEGKLYLFGGKSGDDFIDTVYQYDPETDRWQERSPLTAPRAFAGAAIIGGRIHLLGGYDGQQALNLNEAYFPARDEDRGTGAPSAWDTFAPLPDRRYAMGVASLAGMVFLLGGEGEQVGELPALQYQPETNTWALFDRPPTAVQAQPALIPYGNFLYAIGGDAEDGLSAAIQSYQAIYTISVPLLQND